MRKKIAMLLAFVLTMAISMAIISSAKATISDIEWIGPVRQAPSYDYFYDAYVVAYETGTDWTLTINVNSYVASPIWDYKPVNVSRIIVWFDWGVNYTKTYDYPLPQVPEHGAMVFTVSNTTPTTATASNMFPHEYTVYVEHAKNTSTRVSGGATFSYFWGSIGYTFAAYSTDQKAAMSSEDRYNFLAGAYTGPWNSTEGASLRAQATQENSRGDDFYNRGDFANAKTSYSTAVSKFEEAIAAEDEYDATYENVYLNNLNATGTATLTNANANMKQAEAAQTEADAALVEANAGMVTANATKTQADAALTNAYGWYAIGIGFAIGWTLMGIGVVIYALRKPKPA